MKSLTRILFSLILGIATAPSWAGGCGGLLCTSRITRLYINNTGDALYMLADGLSGVSGCTPNSGVYLTLKAADSNFKMIYATLLAAQTQGQPVGMRLFSDPVGCMIGYVLYDTP